MKSDHQKPVTLEDLLRLKRAERPSAEFWPRFERELRAKQLAALVVKRPWWQTLPSRALAGFSRYHLPIGATAVLALTFLSVREYQTFAPERGITPILLEDNAASPAAPAVSTFDQVATLGSVQIQNIGPTEIVGATEPVDAKGPVAELSDAGGPDRVSAMAALIGGATETGTSASPSARSIAENFAAAQSVGGTFGGQALLATAVHGFESRAMPARTPVVDPLAQMKAPSDVRRARYLGTALPVAANSRQTTPRSSERLASRISDDRLYDSASSRLGVGGDRFMVKF
jgi:hypothetical protein